MKRLVLDLVKIRVRPYYIYQCDLSMGIEHFEQRSQRVRVMEALRSHISGYAVPLQWMSLAEEADACTAPVPISMSPTKVGAAQL